VTDSSPVVQVLRLPHHEGLELPARATIGAAGYDVASAEPEFTIQPMERRLVRTGLALAIPAGYEAQMRPRSGLALTGCYNTPAIGSDYRGELLIAVINLGTSRRWGAARGSPRWCFMVEDVGWTVDRPRAERGRGGSGPGTIRPRCCATTASAVPRVRDHRKVT
jgi:dUTP pyrophosphatase